MRKGSAKGSADGGRRLVESVKVGEVVGGWKRREVEAGEEEVVENG